MPLDPFDTAPIDPAIAVLPKADLHIHQEEVARLERVVARREGRAPYDFRSWARRLVVETPPDVGRINGVYASDKLVTLGHVPADSPEYVRAKMVDLFEEEAADGAVLVEVTFGVTGIAFSRPEFLTLFREAENLVRERYPSFRAEPIGFMIVGGDESGLAAGEQRLATCLRMARDGLAGVNLRVDPYDTQAPPGLWAVAYRWAERIADAGLGLTMHAGEFSSANLAAALRTPGLRRIGHATHAADDPRLLDEFARSGVTAECCLTCNVVLGAIPSYEQHPIRKLVSAGIPVTLNTDLPAHIGTTIGREYATAARLGFTMIDLRQFTRNSIQASFTSADHRVALLDALRRV